MRKLKRAFAAAGLLVSAAVSLNVSAEPPGGSKAATAHPPGKGERPRGPHAEPRGAGATAAASSDAPGAAASAAPGRRHPRALGAFHSKLRQLGEDLRSGKLKKEELKEQLERLHQNTKERRDRHRAELKERWGEQLAKSDVRQELRLHERRMARLNRLLVLAQTERTGKDAEKLTARIEKLVELENTRHEKRMAQLAGAPAVPAPAASAAVNEEEAK